jgi:hypothetical protein
MILSSQVRASRTTARLSGVRELREQLLNGGHAERLIIAPDDHGMEEAPHAPPSDSP